MTMKRRVQTIMLCLAALLIWNKAYADFRDIVAQRFSSSPEYVILNLPPRPGSWPGTIYSSNMRVPFAYGKPDDPVLHRGATVSITAQEGYDIGATAKGGISSWVKLSADASSVADVVMFFPDAQIVDMSYADLVRRIETSAEAIAVAKRGQIPVIIIKAYVGTPTIVVTKKDAASADAWARLSKQVSAGASAKATAGNSITYQAGAPIPFAFEISQIEFDPSDLARGKVTVRLAALPTTLFAFREAEGQIKVQVSSDGPNDRGHDDVRVRPAVSSGKYVHYGWHRGHDKKVVIIKRGRESRY
jgi:hypothetical protein